MQKKEVCWNITTRCNQCCKYCHRFLNISDLSFEENKQILKNLIADGITDITWTGGEALMYHNIELLIEYAFNNGIKNKLITNGEILANIDIKKITSYLDSLTLSIDSVNNKTNEKLGRGDKHYNNIKYILDSINNSNLKIRINTVANKINLNEITELIEFLNNYNIYAWRIFRFMPLREIAVVNKEKFEITDQEFLRVKKIIKQNSNIKKIEYREEKDMEEKYLLLVANGDIIVTENGCDIKKGNALNDNIGKFM